MSTQRKETQLEVRDGRLQCPLCDEWTLELHVERICTVRMRITEISGTVDDHDYEEEDDELIDDNTHLDDTHRYWRCTTCNDEWRELADVYAEAE